MCTNISIKNSQVICSYLPIPILPPYNPNAPEFLKGNLRIEKKSHKALISNNN